LRKGCIQLVNSRRSTHTCVERRTKYVGERGRSSSLFPMTIVPRPTIHSLLLAAIFPTTSRLTVRRPQICERVALAHADGRRTLHRVEPEDISALGRGHLCVRPGRSCVFIISKISDLELTSR
jgi:hypothetical protein